MVRAEDGRERLGRHFEVRALFEALFLLHDGQLAVLVVGPVVRRRELRMSAAAELEESFDLGGLASSVSTTSHEQRIHRQVRLEQQLRDEVLSALQVPVHSA